MAADYPVVIAGGGYAGLAAALALGPRALVIDQHAIGAVQRSACGVPTTVAERLDAAEAVLQVSETAVLHSARQTRSFRLNPSYCTLDHARFCQTLFARSGTAFERARVRGLDGQTVLTSAGPVRGEVLIDASGWPAALATARRPELAERARLSVGIEAEVEGRDEGLHFWVDPAVAPNGYAWLFPAGPRLQIGVVAFEPRPSDLSDRLARFLARLGYAGEPCRGGAIPWFERPAIVDGIFLAGDAAGHCLPLSAEGIRFALAFGELAGRLAAEVIDGGLSAEVAHAIYERRAALHRRRTRWLRGAQRLAGVLPNRAVDVMASLLAVPPLERRAMTRYAGWSVVRDLGSA